MLPDNTQDYTRSCVCTKNILMNKFVHVYKFLILYGLLGYEVRVNHKWEMKMNENVYISILNESLAAQNNRTCTCNIRTVCDICTLMAESTITRNNTPSHKAKRSDTPSYTTSWIVETLIWLFLNKFQFKLYGSFQLKVVQSLDHLHGNAQRERSSRSAPCCA